MKKIFLSVVLCASVAAYGQTINPSDQLVGEPKTPDAPAIATAN